MANSLSA